MVQHLMLAMITPIFLALGAPITLALRTLPPGGRTRLTAVIHSRVLKVLTFPAVAGVIFVANPFLLYFTGYYEATLRNPLLHDLNHVHFVLIGSLWYLATARRRPDASADGASPARPGCLPDACRSTPSWASG